MVCRHKSRRSRAKARLDSNNVTILNASSSSARLRHLAARRSGLVPFQAAPSRRAVRVSRDDRIVVSNNYNDWTVQCSQSTRCSIGQIWRTSCHACPDYLSLNKTLGTDMQARRGLYGGEMLLCNEIATRNTRHPLSEYTLQRSKVIQNNASCP